MTQREERAALPLDLPRYTFIVGPPHCGQHDLAESLIRRNNLQFFDFEEPLRGATAQLFYNGFSIARDLSNPEVRREELPLKTTTTVETWLSNLDWFLVQQFGPTYRGQIAVKDFLEDYTTATVFDYFLWRDARSAADIRPFVEHPALAISSEALCLHVGPLEVNYADYGSGIHHIWLPEPSTEKRMRQIEIELKGARNAAE